MRLLRRVSLVLLGAFFIVAGIGHFRSPAFYLPMMPPYLPWHAELVFLSGVAEVALGAAVLVAPLRRLAAFGLIALLVAVFPANVHVALHDVPLGGAETGLGSWNWVRLPVQGLLIAWAFWHTRPEAAAAAPPRAAAAALALLCALAVAGPARAQLDAAEREIHGALLARRGELEATLAEWVAINTGTFHREGLERLAGRIAPRLAALDFDVETLPGAELELPGAGRIRTGPLVAARRPARAAGPDAPRLLLVGHMDTVFEPSSSFQRFERAPGGARASGPGVADMKGGLLVMCAALEALGARGELDAASFTVLLNSDEEIGSLGSRARIEAAARRASVGLVFEPAHDGGALVRSRRGLGQFHLTVTGVAAHAGSSHEKGRSAIRELAEKVLRIEALTDYARGVTLNVGTIRGGTKRNIVPERAEAWVDLRYDDAALGEEIRARIEAIAAETHVAGTETSLWGTLHRPPKAADAATLRLIELYTSVARDLGTELPPTRHAGGGTDGSLMNAVGLPTLDSLGVVGGRAHTDREFIELASLPERAAAAALFLRRLAAGAAAAGPGQPDAPEL